jgi:hypothetical protein
MNKITGSIVILVILTLEGCSYHAQIRKDSPAVSTKFSDSPASGVTLIDVRDEIEDQKFKHGVATLNYDVKDSLLNVARTALETSFNRVDISKSPIANNQIYAIPHFIMKAEQGNDITTGLLSYAKIDLYDTHSKQLIDSISTSKQSTYYRPGSLNSLSLLTGFTLFMATPFTLPAAVNIAGDSVGELIKTNEQELASSLGSELAASRKMAAGKQTVENCALSISQDPNLQPLSGKISLSGVRDQTFDMLANTSRPNADEKQLLRLYALKSEECSKEQKRIFGSSNPPREVIALFDAIMARKSNLIIELYNGGITYGEFARRRRENSAEFDGAMAKTLAELDHQAMESLIREQQMSLAAERNSIARAQANAAESMAFQSMIGNIQQANSNLIQQQKLNRLNTQSTYRSPVNTTCRPGLGSINCTSY